MSQELIALAKKLKMEKAAREAEQIRLAKVEAEQESLKETLAEINYQQSNDIHNVFIHATAVQKLIAGPVPEYKALSYQLIKDFIESFHLLPSPILIADNNATQISIVPNLFTPIWQAPLIFMLNGVDVSPLMLSYIDFSKNHGMGLVNDQYPQEQLNLTKHDGVKFLWVSHPVLALGQSNTSFIDLMPHSINITKVEQLPQINEAKSEQKAPGDLTSKIDQAKLICDSKVAPAKTELCNERAKEFAYLSCKEQASNPKDYVGCIVEMHKSHLSSCDDLLDLCGEIFNPFLDLS